MQAVHAFFAEEAWRCTALNFPVTPQNDLMLQRVTSNPKLTAVNTTTTFRTVFDRLRRLARKAASPDPLAQFDLDAPTGTEVTGLTLFHDPLLRLRNLTGEPLADSMGDPALAPGVFKIRLAQSRTSSEQAGTLIKRRYAWRGYEIPGLRQDSNLRTFVAYRDNAMVGTVSLRMDSENGLSGDDLYKAEITELRNAGARLCEFTRLAVEDEAVSKTVLGSLFHTAYMYAHLVRECAYGIIEVNPRHAVFYRRSLFFELIGPERMNQRVNAPSVLLCVSFEKIQVELKKYFAGPRKPGKLMFSHWFPPNEADGVLNRLRHLQ